MEIAIGTKGHAENTVTQKSTALAMGSGTLEVFATPCMAALMENAAERSIAPFLGEGQSSVGTALSITHERATPVGMKVWAESEVTAADGRRVSFSVEAYDERGLIGRGTHERFIIDSERFLAKCYGKQ